MVEIVAGARLSSRDSRPATALAPIHAAVVATFER